MTTSDTFDHSGQFASMDEAVAHFEHASRERLEADLRSEGVDVVAELMRFRHFVHRRRSILRGYVAPMLVAAAVAAITVTALLLVLRDRSSNVPQETAQVKTAPAVPRPSPALRPSATTAASPPPKSTASRASASANPCSRTAPCKTFARAISEKANGGENSVRDPAGWLAITNSDGLVVLSACASGGDREPRSLASVADDVIARLGRRQSVLHIAAHGMASPDWNDWILAEDTSIASSPTSRLLYIRSRNLVRILAGDRTSTGGQSVVSAWTTSPPFMDGHRSWLAGREFCGGNVRGVEELATPAAYAALNRLTPVTYAYDPSPKTSYLGFMAEDIPELVSSDRTGLSTADIVAVLTKVVQEQQHTIEENLRTLAELQRQIDEVKKPTPPRG